MAVAGKKGYVRRKAYTYKRNGKTIHVKASYVKKATKTRSTKGLEIGYKTGYLIGRNYCTKTGKYPLFESKLKGTLFYIKNGKKVYPKTASVRRALC